MDINHRYRSKRNWRQTTIYSAPDRHRKSPRDAEYRKQEFAAVSPIGAWV